MKLKSNEENFSWRDLIKSIWYFLDKNRTKYLICTTLITIIYFYPLVPPYLVSQIVSFFNNYKSGESLLPFYIYIFLLGYLTCFAVILRLTFKDMLWKIEAETTHRARTLGFEKLINFSITWHQKENTGNKIEKIYSGSEQLHQLMYKFYSEVLTIFTSVMGVLVVVSFLNPKLLFFMVPYIFVFVLIEYLYYGKVKNINQKIHKSKEEATGTYFESSNNILTIKTLGISKSVKDKVFNKESVHLENKLEFKRLMTNKWMAFLLFDGIGLAMFVYFISISALNSYITPATIFVFYYYYKDFSHGARNGSVIIGDLISLKSGIGRMMPIFNINENKNFGDKEFPSKWNSIKIQNGSFSYKEKSKNFKIKNLNIEINKNEKIGIVGRSGSGKSTLAKVLLGLYKLKQGKFLIENEDYYQISHEEITKKISIVLQESELFNLSLRENITMMRDIDEELFLKAIKISQLEEVINKLPEGLETLIGEKGYRLSGGERQRLGIARAICKDPEILVLDEATSALDNKTESLIQEGIEKELKEKTLIIIAHRITTLRNVDRVLVFEKGEIVEEGGFGILMNNPISKFNEISKVNNYKSIKSFQLEIA